MASHAREGTATDRRQHSLARIIDTTLELMREKGPGGVTVEAVLDVFAKHSHPTCPSRPPSNADSAIDEDLTGSSGTVRPSSSW